MESEICVICLNQNTVNHTNNRLVTESCGHVKCMDCLLNEKNGCQACLRTLEETKEGSQTEDNTIDTQVSDVEEWTPQPEADNIQIVIKKKPETSHIKVEKDANGKHFLCTVCQKKFTARSQVSYHAYCNGQTKPYVCSKPNCNKSFATLSHYKYHMMVHNEEKMYTCDMCDESFYQKSKLQRHTLKHTQEKKYSCTQPACSKSYTTYSALKKHSITHTEDRPFVCSLCDKRFNDVSNYRRHLSKHDSTGKRSSLCNRPFPCTRCSQAFGTKKDLLRHSVVHTDAKPFRCKVCDRKFRRKDNLERHIRNTHQEYTPSNAVAIENQTVDSTEGATVATIDNNTYDEMYQSVEKTKLEILNPLPPLPKEVIQRHMHETIDKSVTNPEEDMSYILEANIARESVIFGPVRKDVTSYENKNWSEHGYVHKIKKLNWSQNKDLSLPPIDERKFIQLEHEESLNKLDVGMPQKNMEVLKKILHPGKPETAKMEDVHNAAVHSETSSDMHWRRRYLK